MQVEIVQYVIWVWCPKIKSIFYRAHKSMFFIVIVSSIGQKLKILALFVEVKFRWQIQKEQVSLNNKVLSLMKLLDSLNLSYFLGS